MKEIHLISANEYQTSERFYAVPKILFESDYYKEMRLDTKFAYSVLKDRLSLSLKNNWIDEEGYIFLMYSNSKLMEILNCSKSTLLRIKKQLSEYGLIREVQQSTSKSGNLANRIYLGQLKDDSISRISENTEDSSSETRGVSNLDQGGVKKILGGCQIDTGLVSNSAPNDTDISDTDYNGVSISRKANQISKEIFSPTGATDLFIPEKSVKYIQPEYYSLLQVIADRYNGKFTQLDLFTGEFQNYKLTHHQKMLIGQYLSDGYATSGEVLDIIERIPIDSESPLAYLLKCLENLKEERRLEAKMIAHRNAEMKYDNLEKAELV
ncbi:replication initiator protein A [Streptococcus anginosus]|uniref:replication initiator protein A n=1 Tax=Streptococcus anginosus TaxID=1328 RepID=UPI0039C33777